MPNLSADKPRVFAEAARVLRPGGGFAVSDVVAGALTEDEFRSAPTAAGFAGVEVRVAHRVHAHAGSAVIRTRKPA